MCLEQLLVERLVLLEHFGQVTLAAEQERKDHDRDQHRERDQDLVAGRDGCQ